MSLCSSGCEKRFSIDFSRNKTTRVEIASIDNQPIREYNVHLPDDIETSHGHSIVFSFHGHKGDMFSQEDISELSQENLRINNIGIIAVYPQGIKGTDGGYAWQGAPYSQTYIDDIIFVEKIIDDLQSKFCIDSSRIYATGKSNGGGFVNLLSNTPSIAHKFAAIATISGAFYKSTFNEIYFNRPHIPIIDFHGTNDTVTPYNGKLAHGEIQVSIYDFLKDWRLRNECNNKETISYLSKEIDSEQLIEIQTWTNTNDYRGIVQEYKITQGQHSWPRTTLPLKCNGIQSTNDCSTTVFNCTIDVIIPFFNQYSL